MAEHHAKLEQAEARDRLSSFPFPKMEETELRCRSTMPAKEEPTELRSRLSSFRIAKMEPTELG